MKKQKKLFKFTLLLILVMSMSSASAYSYTDAFNSGRTGVLKTYKAGFPFQFTQKAWFYTSYGNDLGSATYKGSHSDGPIYEIATAPTTFSASLLGAVSTVYAGNPHYGDMYISMSLYKNLRGSWTTVNNDDWYSHADGDRYKEGSGFNIVNLLSTYLYDFYMNLFMEEAIEVLNGIWNVEDTSYVSFSFFNPGYGEDWNVYDPDRGMDAQITLEPSGLDTRYEYKILVYYVAYVTSNGGYVKDTEVFSKIKTTYIRFSNFQSWTISPPSGLR